MIIHAGCDIITRMDISVLATTNDIEQLRTLALAMVQNVVSENAEKEEKLRRQNTTLQQRFGKKGETLAGMQRSLFEEDVDAGIAAVEAQLDTQLPAEEKAAPERPARKPLPAHLPRVTKTIEPASTENCPDCQGVLRHIRDEVSEKLEYIPARSMAAPAASGCAEKHYSWAMR